MICFIEHNVYKYNNNSQKPQQLPTTLQNHKNVMGKIFLKPCYVYESLVDAIPFSSIYARNKMILALHQKTSSLRKQKKKTQRK